MDHLKKVRTSSKNKVLKKDREYFEVAHTSNQGKEKAVLAWKDDGSREKERSFC